MKFKLNNCDLFKIELKPENSLPNVYNTKRLIIAPGKLIRILCLIILFLILSSLLSVSLRHFYANTESVVLFYRLFNLDKEGNIPTFFSSFLLLFASLLLWLTGVIDDISKAYWRALSIIFLYLSIDEAAQIHEIFLDLKPKIELLNRSNMTNVWVFPYLLLVIVIGIVVRKFIFNRPAITRNLFMLSAFIYVGGALGLEIVEEQIKILNEGRPYIILTLLYHLEEVCEMVGVIIFIYAILKYLTFKTPQFSVFIKK